MSASFHIDHEDEAGTPDPRYGEGELTHSLDGSELSAQDSEFLEAIESGKVSTHRGKFLGRRVRRQRQATLALALECSREATSDDDFESRVRAGASERKYGIDPATIILILKLAYMVWKWWKARRG